MKLTLKHAIVVFGILPVLAACGGGGGDDPEPMPPAGITPEEATSNAQAAHALALGAISAASDASTDAANAMSAIPASSGVTAAEGSTAHTGGTAAKMAAEAALADAQMALADAMKAKADAEQAEMDGADASAVALAKATANSAISQAMAAETAAQNAKMAAETFLGGFSVADRTHAETMAKAYAKLIMDTSRASALPTGITVSGGEASGAVQDGKFDGTDLSKMDGWAGMRSTRTTSTSGDPVTVTVVAYTNKDANTGQALDAFRSGSFAETIDATSGERTYEAHTLDTTTITDADMYEDWDHLIKIGDIFKVVKGDIPTGGYMISGNFFGVPGTYTCTAGCAATFDGDGELLTLTGFSFTPAKLAPGQAPHMVMGVVADSAFVDFGHWMQDDDGEMTAGVFVSPNVAGTAITDTASIEGTASYSGPAAGLYVKEHTDGTPVASGTFTADASLEADFRIGSGEITGMISNFMDGGQSIDDSWMLMLNGDAMPNDGNVDTTGVFSGVTKGGGADGTWSGQFYEAAAEAADAPKAAAGTFDGHFTNGDVVGAFGVENDD